jgi:hypothetical protein
MRGSNPEPQEIHLSQSKKVFQQLAKLTTRVPSYLKRVSSFRLRYGCLREQRASSENVARARHAAADGSLNLIRVISLQRLENL